MDVRDGTSWKITPKLYPFQGLVYVDVRTTVRIVSLAIKKSVIKHFRDLIVGNFAKFSRGTCLTMYIPYELYARIVPRVFGVCFPCAHVNPRGLFFDDITRLQLLRYDGRVNNILCRVE